MEQTRREFVQQFIDPITENFFTGGASHDKATKFKKAINDLVDIHYSHIEQSTDSGNFENKIIQVCDHCGRAGCWYGQFMCENYKSAGVEEKTVAELRAFNNGDGNGEHEDNWSDERMEEVYGDLAPFGYRWGDEQCILK